MSKGVDLLLDTLERAERTRQAGGMMVLHDELAVMTELLATVLELERRVRELEATHQ